MRAILATALVLMPLAAHAEAPPAPERDEVRRIAESMGLAEVTAGEVSAAGGSIVARDVRGSLPAPQPGGPAMAVRVGAITIDGLRKDGEARAASLVTAEDLSVGPARFGRLAVSDLQVAAPGAKPRYAAFQAEGIRLSGPEDGSEIAVAGLRLTAEDWRDGVPARSAMQLRGVALAGAAAGKAARAAPEIPQGFDLDSRTTFDAAKGSLTLDEFSLWLGRSAVLRATATFSGLDLGKIEEARRKMPVIQAPTPQAAVPGPAPARAADAATASALMPLALAYGGVRIEGAEIRLEDAGLVRSVLAARAKATRATTEDVADALVAQADAALAPKVSPAFKADTLGAIRAFLAEPRNISLRLAPGEGQGRLFQLFVGLARGFVTAKDLGATVRANQP